MAQVSHSFDQHQSRERRPIRKGRSGYISPEEQAELDAADAERLATKIAEESGDVDPEATDEEVEHVRTFADRVGG